MFWGNSSSYRLSLEFIPWIPAFEGIVRGGSDVQNDFLRAYQNHTVISATYLY